MNREPARRLDTLVTIVTERVTYGKDPAKPYVGLEHIPSGGTSLKNIGSSVDSISTNGIFAPGDILFGKLRPRLRKSVRAAQAGYCSTDVLVLRTVPGVDASFAGFVAQSDEVFRRAIQTEEGTKMPRCSWRDLRAAAVFAPEGVLEQQCIAAVLTSLDNAIEATEALIEKHKQIKAGAMHDLLTRGLIDGGVLRSSVLEAPDLYRRTEIGWVPVGWVVTGLQAKQRRAEKWIRTGPFGSALKGEHWAVEGHPVVTIGSLGEGEFDKHELLFIGERDAARLFEFQLKLGDVVFSRVADVGRSVVVREENVGWIMSSNLMRIAVDPAQVRPDFLQMLLSSDARVKSQIRAKVNSGGREVANSEILGQLLFAWPPVDEQDRIVERVRAIETPIRMKQDQLRKLRMQKQGLMQDLLTGKVRVPMPEAESTAV